MIILIKIRDAEERKRQARSLEDRMVHRKNKTNKERDKEGKGRRDSGYKHVHEHQFNSFSAIPLSSLSNYT